MQAALPALCTCMKLTHCNGVTTLKMVPVEQGRNIDLTVARSKRESKPETEDRGPNRGEGMGTPFSWQPAPVVGDSTMISIALCIPSLRFICRTVGAAVGNPALLLSCQ